MKVFLTAVSIAMCMMFAEQKTANAAERPSVETQSHGARAEVVRAFRKGDVVIVEVRFNATVEPFGGEIVYEGLDRKLVLIEADGKSWPLADTADAAPAELRLNFSYDLSKTPRVGQWKGVFVAPPAEISKITLKLQGLLPIEGVALK